MNCMILVTFQASLTLGCHEIHTHVLIGGSLIYSLRPLFFVKGPKIGEERLGEGGQQQVKTTPPPPPV